MLHVDGSIRISLPTTGTSNDLLIRNTTSGEVEVRDVSSLISDFGDDFWKVSGTTTLTSTVTISGGPGLSINPSGNLYLGTSGTDSVTIGRTVTPTTINGLLTKITGDTSIGTIPGSKHTIQGQVTLDGSLIMNDTSSNQILLPLNADPTAPTIGFGDGDTGMYQHVDGGLSLAFGGVRKINFNGLSMWGQSSNGFLLEHQQGLSSTTPIYTFLADADTGMNSGAADELSLITGGVQAINIDASSNVTLDVSTAQLRLPSFNDAATPTLAFGDGNTGFYEITDNDIGFSSNGALKWQLTGSYFGNSNLGGGGIFKTSSTATQPSLMPRLSDTNTGIGGLNADTLSLIAGGLEGVRVSEIDSSVYVNIYGDTTIAGNLTLNGSTFIVDSEITTADAVIDMNDGEVGSGVTLGYSGLHIDRGGLDNFWLGFDEVRDLFTVGQITALSAGQIATTQVVATREDGPNDNGIAFWDSTQDLFETSSLFVYDGSSLSVNADQDASIILGRAKIFSASTDIAYFSHFDNDNTTDFSLFQTAAGITSINSKSGQILNIKQGNVLQWGLRANGDLYNAAGNTLTVDAADVSILNGGDLYIADGSIILETNGKVEFNTDTYITSNNTDTLNFVAGSGATEKFQFVGGILQGNTGTSGAAIHIGGNIGVAYAFRGDKDSGLQYNAVSDIGLGTNSIEALNINATQDVSLAAGLLLSALPSTGTSNDLLIRNTTSGEVEVRDVSSLITDLGDDFWNVSGITNVTDPSIVGDVNFDGSVVITGNLAMAFGRIEIGVADIFSDNGNTGLIFQLPALSSAWENGFRFSGSTFSDNDFILMNIYGTALQVTTNSYTGIKLNITETTVGTGDKLLMDLHVDAASKFKVDNAGWITSAENTDATTILGRTRIDSREADEAVFSHYDASGTGDYAIKQSFAGVTDINSATGYPTRFNIADVEQWRIHHTGDLKGQTGNELWVDADVSVGGDIFLSSGNLTRGTHNSGHLEGGFNNIGDSNARTNPIFTIGSDFNPNELDLDGVGADMYGIGFSKGASTTFLNATDLGVAPSNSWGLYVAADGNARIFLDGTNGKGYFGGTLFAEDAYIRNDVSIGANLLLNTLPTTGTSNDLLIRNLTSGEVEVRDVSSLISDFADDFWQTSGSTVVTDPSIVGDVNFDGSVGIYGNLDVFGAISGTTKSFKIVHPDKESTGYNFLQYGSVEAPEHSVIIRGRIKNENVIVLPNHWKNLVHDDSITVQLTSRTKWNIPYVKDVSNNSITVGKIGFGKINAFYTVNATRKDVPNLNVEY
jgi:hypothetical protein